MEMVKDKYKLRWIILKMILKTYTEWEQSQHRKEEIYLKGKMNGVNL